MTSISNRFGKSGTQAGGEFHCLLHRVSSTDTQWNVRRPAELRSVRRTPCTGRRVPNATWGTLCRSGDHRNSLREAQHRAPNDITDGGSAASCAPARHCPRSTAPSRWKSPRLRSHRPRRSSAAMWRLRVKALTTVKMSLTCRYHPSEGEADTVAHVANEQTTPDSRFDSIAQSTNRATTLHDTVRLHRVALR